MSISQSLLPEYDMEMANTRKVLERVPDDRLSWKAHEKSNSIGWLANHLADIPGWMSFTLDSDSLDVAPPGGKQYDSPKLESRQAILELFDKNVAAGRSSLAAATDEKFVQPWSLLQGGRVIFTMPKVAVVRGFVLSHIIHHRAIMTVYLRLNNIPVPALYGPSGDESGM